MEAVVRGDLPKEINKRRESERFAKYPSAERVGLLASRARNTESDAVQNDARTSCYRTVEVDQAMHAIQSFVERPQDGIDRHEGR